MLQTLTQIGKPAYEEIYEKHYGKVFQYIYRKIGNFSEAEDLTSEAFLYAYKHYDQYDPSKSAIATWLYLIVNSRLNNYYRDSRICIDLETVVGVLEDDTVDLEQGAYMEEVSEQLQEAIKGHRLEMAILLSLYTGIRQGELLCLLPVRRTLQ